ncbi:GTP-binding protein REM 2 isoform X2 [Neophocaena asiaeorientalis asiaeorientalis]|uniref:GTP-binding protein REM 2 n=4 Tax=Odontoceti TaxID=9722 RepID=A0A8C6BCR0_MONMO|nr:GTP-binding protein REM 2 [Delphinapterus leucas]XP_024597461.1 GTP-binding protein REM 2 isoform X2 [Neophocaena asiaeorientalis asiaeorientalis]XP_026966579.1 GTP-binding protein REM 2 isoform X1 [Lagenorhynchus obliquidens]XP_029093244.1 GTP-binding protein REM 2 [Monodon monoceros]XP_033707248.1 GTP-binding protein REM 2 isoform X1 [Tursiops truncatus]
MHTDLDTDMDTDTETTALCPASSHRASPPGTPTPEADATLLKKPEKLLAGLDWGGPPPAPGAPRRRGSMPVPYKHQLRRAQAVDELDWPPQASSSGSSDSLGSGEAAPTQKDGIFKVMLVGESGVGKSTLAGTFGGLQGDSAHELENPEDTYERRIMVDKEEVTLVVYDIWEQGDAGGWLQDHCLQTGDAFLIVFSVTDRQSFSKVPETLLRLRAGRPQHDLPVILVGNKSDLARSREVSLEEGRHLAGTLSCKHIETSAALHHNTRELFEGAVRQIRLRRGPNRAGGPQPEWGRPEGPAPPTRRESLTKKAKRFLANLVPRNTKFFKQRSRSCHDLSVL